MYIYIYVLSFLEKTTLSIHLLFLGEKRSQKDVCWKIHKEVGPPLGSNRLPRRMMPSTTAVSILVTVKSHWGATPLRDGNGRCPGFSSWGWGHLHVIDVFFPDSKPDFWMNHMAIVIFPMFKWEIYLSWFMIYDCIFSSQIFFHQRAQKLWGESPIRSHHPEVPRWGLALPESLAWLREQCPSKWPHWFFGSPGIRGCILGDWNLRLR